MTGGWYEIPTGKSAGCSPRRLDVDVPDEIAGYSEGQKIVGAYVRTKVYDAESSLPDKMVPEYVSVTNAYKDGLPYDFDQVRVFTWNTKKHRLRDRLPGNAVSRATCR